MLNPELRMLNGEIKNTNDPQIDSYGDRGIPEGAEKQIPQDPENNIGVEKKLDGETDIRIYVNGPLPQVADQIPYAGTAKENGDSKVPDEQGTKWNEISEIEKHIRLGFIRKVYSILILQLWLTFGIVCLSFSIKVRLFIWLNWYIIPAVGGLELILFFIIVCNAQFARRVPGNYILLIWWTVMISYLLMVVSCYYDIDIVLSAIGITIGIVVGLTIYACFTKTNFTYCFGFLFCVLFWGMTSALFGLLFNKWLYVAYCAGGVLLYSLFLVYDTQWILGHFRIKFSIDDYIFASLCLYVDIIKIFLRVWTLGAIK